MSIARRVSVNLLTRDIGASVTFYRALLGYREVHAEPWYVVLASDVDSDFQLGLIDWVSEFVPRAARGEAQGSYLAVVVDDVEAAVEAVRALGAEIVEEPTRYNDLTRAVVRDFDQHVIDITTPQARYVIPPRKAVS